MNSLRSPLTPRPGAPAEECRKKALDIADAVLEAGVAVAVGLARHWRRKVAATPRRLERPEATSKDTYSRSAYLPQLYVVVPQL